MERLTNKTITKEEKEVINSWLDFYECQKIRNAFYGIVEDKKYLKQVKILEKMFEKYDSFLDKNEPIYRGIRFKKGIDDKRFIILIENLNKSFKNNEIIQIDKAPSSFTKNKEVAYNEFAKVESDEFYSIIFEVINRKSNELYIKDYAGKFAYQEEIIIKSHKAKYEIIEINKSNDIIIIKLKEIE